MVADILSAGAQTPDQIWANIPLSQVSLAPLTDGRMEHYRSPLHLAETDIHTRSIIHSNHGTWLICSWFQSVPLPDEDEQTLIFLLHCGAFNQVMPF